MIDIATVAATTPPTGDREAAGDERRSGEQPRLRREIARQESAERCYLGEGVKLLEFAQSA